MKGRTRFGALLLACAFVLALPAGASAAVFLELSGIQGESTARGFENQIEIREFQFDLGRDKATALFSDITLSKELDKSSPALMLRAANGTTIPSARIRFAETTDAAPIVYLRYCLTGVRVNSYSQSSGDERPTEIFSLGYNTIVQSYTQQAAAGGGGTVFDEGWDLVKGLQFGGACGNN